MPTMSMTISMMSINKIDNDVNDNVNDVNDNINDVNQ